MAAASLCLMISATLTIQPDRFQFFRYETFTVDCATSGNFSGWTLKRNTSSGSNVVCDRDWGEQYGSSCLNSRLYTSDSGVYWCESESGECSNVLNITVTTAVVILESPARPVAAGDDVTLRCSYRERYAPSSSSNFEASFFRNGTFIGTNPEGTLTLPKVSKADAALYKCEHPSGKASPESLLAVRVRAQPDVSVTPSPPPPPRPVSPMRVVCWVLLFILYNIIFMLCLYTCWRKARARARKEKKTSHGFRPV